MEPQTEKRKNSDTNKTKPNDTEEKAKETGTEKRKKLGETSGAINPPKKGAKQPT